MSGWAGRVLRVSAHIVTDAPTPGAMIPGVAKSQTNQP